MEEKTTQQLIEERFAQLPKVIQSAITNSNWVENLRKIISENNLLIDQGLVIETETFLMMLGLEHPSAYTKNIKKEANLTKEQAIKIATEVEKRILVPVKKLIIEETEKEAGIEENPLEEILGKDPEIENSLPSIKTDLDDESSEDRESLINELEGDIKIENDEDDELMIIEQPENELDSGISKSGIPATNQAPDNLPTGNKIPVLEDTDPNPRFIETNFSKEPDNLPSLEPVRTLETDSENRDDIVTSKFGGATIKKPEIKKEEEVSEIPQKPAEVDPYRESIK